MTCLLPQKQVIKRIHTGQNLRNKCPAQKSQFYIHSLHSSWQRLLGPKKSPRKSTYIGPKVHIVATWGTLK